MKEFTGTAGHGGFERSEAAAYPAKRPLAELFDAISDLHFAAPPL
jgi:hypothetical protein